MKKLIELASKKVSPKTAVGSIAVSAFGISTVLTVQSVREWFLLMTEFFPLVSILGMAGLVYYTLRQHGECQRELAKLHEQMRATYMIVRRSIRQDDALPQEEQFARGEFVVSDIERAMARRSETPAAAKKTGRRKSDQTKATKTARKTPARRK